MSDVATNDIRDLANWVATQQIDDLPDHVIKAFMNLRLNLREGRRFVVLTHEEAHEEWSRWFDEVLRRGAEVETGEAPARGWGSRHGGWRSWLPSWLHRGSSSSGG